MFKKAAHNRTDADVLGDAGNAGPERTDPAHDEVDLHAGAGRLIQRDDGVDLNQGVHFRDDPRRATLRGVRRFALNQLQHPGVQGEGRLQDFLELAGPAWRG